MFSVNSHGRLLIAGLLSFFCSQAAAEGKPLWEAGAGIGVVNFPDYRGSDERSTFVLPIPYFVYRGEFLKVDRDSVRGRLFESERLKLDVSLNGSVPVDSDDNEAREGMDDLDPTLEVGPVLKYHAWRSEDETMQLDLRFPLRAVISTEPEHIGWIAQPQLNLDILNPFGYKGWKLGLLTGPVFGDEEYHDYFYGVDPQFARPGRPAYEADGGYAGAQVIAALSKRFPKMWVGGFLKWDTLDGAEFEDSPLVKDKSNFTAGFAITWVLKVSEELVDVSEED